MNIMLLMNPSFTTDAFDIEKFDLNCLLVTDLLSDPSGADLTIAFFSFFSH